MNERRKEEMKSKGGKGRREVNRTVWTGEKIIKIGEEQGKES